MAGIENRLVSTLCGTLIGTSHTVLYIYCKTVLRQDADRKWQRRCYGTKFGIVHAVKLHDNSGGLWVQISEVLLLMHTAFQLSIFLVRQG